MLITNTFKTGSTSTSATLSSPAQEEATPRRTNQTPTQQHFTGDSSYLVLLQSWGLSKDSGTGRVIYPGNTVEIPETPPAAGEACTQTQCLLPGPLPASTWSHRPHSSTITRKVWQFSLPQLTSDSCLSYTLVCYNDSQRELNMHHFNLSCPHNSICLSMFSAALYPH